MRRRRARESPETSTCEVRNRSGPNDTVAERCHATSRFRFPLSDFHFPFSTFQLPFSNFQPRKRTAFTGWVYSRPIMRGVRGIYRPVTGRPCVACVLLRHNFSSTDSISKKKLYFISVFSIDLYTARRYGSLI